jgi:hypothetical protein
MNTLALLLALLLVLPISVSAVIFDLPAYPDGSSDNQQCFYMYIGKDVMFTGHYKVSDGYNQQVNVEVFKYICKNE